MQELHIRTFFISRSVVCGPSVRFFGLLFSVNLVGTRETSSVRCVFTFNTVTRDTGASIGPGASTFIQRGVAGTVLYENRVYALEEAEERGPVP